MSYHLNRYRIGKLYFKTQLLKINSVQMLKQARENIKEFEACEAIELAAIGEIQLVDRQDYSA